MPDETPSTFIARLDEGLKYVIQTQAQLISGQDRTNAHLERLNGSVAKHNQEIALIQQAREERGEVIAALADEVKTVCADMKTAQTGKISLTPKQIFIFFVACIIAGAGGNAIESWVSTFS